MSIGSSSLLLSIGASLALSGCGNFANFGKVEQGRVIAYDKEARVATVVAETPDSPFGALPPVKVRLPEDPDEMGPAPTPGKLIRTDLQGHRITIFDSAAGQFRTIDYTPVKEVHGVAKAPGPPKIDREARTITIYSSRQKTVLTFVATDDLLALPPDTWRPGDTVRYYFKKSGQALRMMNVTRTDLAKS
ncbi:MAG TPA: DUF4881 domain-containing protein [Bryobacteraceae bacterium]|nr:DUF4881 domain-containing protein [Bryobacteraceae bacterium]